MIINFTKLNITPRICPLPKLTILVLFSKVCFSFLLWSPKMIFVGLNNHDHGWVLCERLSGFNVMLKAQMGFSQIYTCALNFLRFGAPHRVFRWILEITVMFKINKIQTDWGLLNTQHFSTEDWLTAYSSSLCPNIKSFPAVWKSLNQVKSKGKGLNFKRMIKNGERTQENNWTGNLFSRNCSLLCCLLLQLLHLMLDDLVPLQRHKNRGIH